MRLPFRRARAAEPDRDDLIAGAAVGCRTCDVRLEVPPGQDPTAGTVAFFTEHGEGHDTWVDLGGPRD